MSGCEDPVRPNDGLKSKAGGEWIPMPSFYNRSPSTLMNEWKRRYNRKNRPNKSSQCKRSSAMENLDYEPNPEVVPFQPANFIRHHSVLPIPLTRSSTILKRVPIPKRHQDTFGGYEYNFIGKRGVMLHTDRYQIDFIKSLDGMTQRERLQAGFDYMEAMRGTRRRREMVPHRAQLDLIMGGKQIEFEERFDITREIQKLKSIAMPKHAKDLFHGRGIHLPNNHLSLHPRFQAPLDDDEFFIPSQSTMPSIPRRSQVPPPNTATSVEFPSVPDFQVNGGQSVFFRANNSLRKHKPLPTIRGKSDAGMRTINRRFGYRGSRTCIPPHLAYLVSTSGSALCSVSYLAFHAIS
ncbi:serine/arginine repetitive matrix protein 1-like isoform x3 [Plakobranchus ocellatus]|uniref:Serine/arginine repetitive matrix protein 1-like isoform x3 n=1 Tax=Plakobranchus ocellatus TaxID=259542 RepID=A0AAV3Y4Z3_9GAST|nr:serine/arginine repetitive matrix protein 1-like isoform x3 [Plakobranchus ocellatus]